MSVSSLYAGRQFERSAQPYEEHLQDMIQQAVGFYHEIAPA